MSSSSLPPPIPVSTVQSTTATPPISTPAFRLFLGRLYGAIGRALSNNRPWSELLDRSAFSRPESLSDAVSRIRKNLSYFRANYAFVLSLVLALSLLSHPFSLVLLLLLLAAWCFLYLFRPSEPPLVLLGRQFTDRETLAGLVVMTIVVVFLTSVGSLLMSAVAVGATLVAVHGAFRVPEDLFMDYEEVAGTGIGMGSVGGGGGGGFLSFLGGAAKSAVATSGGPPAVSRV